MAHRELQVTVISAQDLKNVRLSGRAMSPYAEVWIRSSTVSKVQTGVDSGGGINPSWNSVVKVPCEEELFRSGGAVTIALRHRGSICDKLIGTVTVPLSDLSLQCRAADSNASRESTLMTYQVRMRSGKPHGVLNISVLVGSLVKQASYGKPSVAHPSETAPPVTAYPTSTTGYRQAATSPNVTQYYPPQQVYLPQQSAYPLQHNLHPPQYQPQYAQPAGYNYQQVVY
ncbi:hypothetical protein M758_8G062500 [Ceratodon purpureus]|nr:hypothetical protein M758_8G062500 [Ceratodon purpureus]